MGFCISEPLYIKDDHCDVIHLFLEPAFESREVLSTAIMVFLKLEVTTFGPEGGAAVGPELGYQTKYNAETDTDSY